jgi:hypothetical protein
MKETKSCPFCGSEEIIVGFDGEYSFFCYCKTCFTKGPIAHNHNEAIYLWESQDKPSCPNYGSAESSVLCAASDMLEVLEELQESAEYWSEYDVPLGIVDRMNNAINKAHGRNS